MLLIQKYFMIKLIISKIIPDHNVTVGFNPVFGLWVNGTARGAATKTRPATIRIRFLGILSRIRNVDEITSPSRRTDLGRICLT